MKKQNIPTKIRQSVLLRRLFITCFAMLILSSGYAQITSNGSGAWNNPATWNPASVPSSTDIVTINAADNITVPANATCKQLLISGTLTMTGTGITMDITNNSSAGPTNGLQLNSGSSLTIGATNTLYFSNGQASGIVNNGGTIVSTGVNGIDGGTILANTCCGGEFRISGTAMTTVCNLLFLQNAKFNIASGGLFVNGTLSVPNNNFNAGSTAMSPIYGAGSTLSINNGGQGLGGGTPLNGNLNTLWAAQSGTIGVTAGYPNNVTLLNLGTSSGGVTPAGGSNINVGWRPTGAVGLNGTLRMGDGTGGSPGSNPTGSVIGSLDQVSSFSCGGIIVDNNSTLISPGAVPYTVSGNFTLQGATTGLYYSFATGTNINFNGTGNSTTPQNIITNGTAPIVFANMTVSNGTYVQLQDPVTTGTLTLTSGYVGTTTTNSLTVTNTASTAVTGGGTTSYVDGPLTWALPASAGGSYTFPVGDLSHNGGAYLPITLTSANSTSGTNMTATAYHQDLGGSPDATVTSLCHTDYWSLSASSSLSSGAIVSVSRPSAAVTPNNSLASSTTASGTYSTIGGTPSGTTVSNAGVGSGNPAYITLAVSPLNAVRVGGANAGVDASCNPTNVGSLIVGGVGGTAPYQFSIDGGTTFTTASSSPATFGPLTKGAYNVIIKDATSATQTATLHVLGALQINGNDQDMNICNGTSATLTASNLQNSSPSYSWTSSPAGFTANTATITPTPTVATTYTVSSIIYANNLIPEGDFESGFPSTFITGAGYYNTYSPIPYTGTPDNGGHYTVGTSGKALCSCFTALTPESGNNYYMADGYIDNTINNLFSIPLNGLNVGTIYKFSFYYAQSTANGNFPKLSVSVTGGSITSGPGTINVNNSLAWSQATYFITASATSMTLTLSDPSSRNSTDGYDIYLDNMQFLAPCTVTDAITVTPGPCCPKGVISGTTQICDDGTSTATIKVTLTGTAPWTFVYAIDGVNQAPITTSSSTYTFQSAIAGGSNHTYTLTDLQDAVNTTCTGNYSGSVLISKLTVPSITSIGNDNTCSGQSHSYAITSSVSGTTYKWSRGLTTDISNSAVSNQTSNPITETLINTSAATPPTSPIVNYTIIATAAGCSSAPFTYALTVNPAPVVVPTTPAPSICNGIAQNYLIKDNTGTATFKWNRTVATGNPAETNQTANPITEALVNTGTSPLSVVYVITPTSAANCPGTAYNYTVTVNPTPTLTSLSTGQICSGNAQNYLIKSSVTGSTFSWDRNTATNISNAAVTGQTANPITETLTNTSTTTSAAVNYAITITTPAGCSNAVPINYGVTVNPAPTITSVSSDSTCSGQSHSYSITSSISGTTYKWSRGTTTNISNGAVSNQTSNPITETLTNTSTATPPAFAIVTYTITPSTTSCPGAPFTYSLKVNPAPAVIPTTPAPSICNGIAQNYLIKDNTGTATFTWNRTVATGNPAETNQTANPITETLVNTGTSPLSVVYVITPTSGVGCLGTAYNYMVTVNPTPTLSSLTGGQTCSGAAQNYLIKSSVSGSTFSWDRNTATNISNAAVTGQTANPITEALNNTSATTSATVNYAITITTPAGCSNAVPINYGVTVNPIPAITSIGNDNTCSGQSHSYTIMSSISGTTYNWSRGTTTGISNTAVSNQTSNPITETLINTGTTSPIVAYTITATAGGCPGTPFTYNLTVNPAAMVNSLPKGTVCSGDAQNYTITSNISGATFTWDRAAGAGNPAETGMTANPITEILVNTGTGSAVLRYTITPSGGSCPGIPFNYDVTIVAPPINTQVPVGNSICSGSNGTVTIPNTESGITYQAFIGSTAVSSIGNGNGGNLTLSVSSSSLAVGNNVVSIHAVGCHSTVLTNTATISLTETPVADAGPDVHIDDFTNVTLNGSSSIPAMYHWTSSDASDVIANANLASITVQPNAVSTTFTLTVTDSTNHNCHSSDEVIVYITPKPVQIPNAFSPNGDGIHDKFEIGNIQFFKDAILFVYNQWGELIYKSDAGYPSEWDGTRKGNPVPMGGYYYILELNMEGYKTITGNITLIK